MPTDSAYKSYLLRLWRAGDPQQPIWRASLEEPRTGLRLHFATLERLYAFLDDQTGLLSDTQQPSPSSGDHESP